MTSLQTKNGTYSGTQSRKCRVNNGITLGNINGFLAAVMFCFQLLPCSFYSAMSSADLSIFELKEHKLSVITESKRRS